ncbi:phage holin, partial [Bifidobacterium bifidum]
MANTTGVADHKATGPAIPGLTVERTKAIILLIVQLFSVAQTGLSIAGISQLPFTTDQVSTAITGVIAVIASVYAWWRNNNLTGAAVQG